MDLETYTMVVVSTAHITASEADALDLGDADHLTVIPWSEYGWLIWCAKDADLEGTSDALLRCLEWAQSKGFEYLRLDSDGPEIPDLPKYQW
jgi:hypothetical protein